MTWKCNRLGATALQEIVLDRTVDRVPADLLLPDAIFRRTLRLMVVHGSWRDLVRYLMSRYSQRALERNHDATRLRFLYQEPDQELHRICYLSFRDIQAELRMLSFATRMSMCALVVQMLLWELADLANARSGGFVPAGVPIAKRSIWVVTGHRLIISGSIQTHHPPDRKT